MNTDQLHRLVPWDRLREVWPAGSNPLAKYANEHTDLHCETIITRAIFMGLDRCSPCRVLDIGCGLGLMVEYCRLLGHQALGLDVDAPYNRAMDVHFGGPRIWHTITAFNHLPANLCPFDVVSIARCNLFMDLVGHAKAAEWQRFLAHLADVTRCRLIFVSMNIGEHPQILLKDIKGFDIEWHGDDALLKPNRN